MLDYQKFKTAIVKGFDKDEVLNYIQKMEDEGYAKDAEFAKYESVLADDVNFTALKEKKSEMTLKEIESECAIMYARKNLAQSNFSKSNDGVMTAGLIDNGCKDGFVETKYGYIPVR